MHQCNLDGSQKEGGTFFNLLLKEGVPRMGGSLGKGGGEGGGSNPGRKLRNKQNTKNLCETGKLLSYHNAAILASYI